MGLFSFAKNQYVKGALEKLTHGDTGSTMIGAVAVSLLAYDIDFDAASKILAGDFAPKPITEALKIIAGLGLGLWAWRTGKPKT